MLSPSKSMSLENDILLESWAGKFRAVGCTEVTVTDGHVEIVPPGFPVRTMVEANSFFLQFSTVLFARPQRFLARCRLKRDALLNQANRTAHLARFTCDDEKVDRESGCWNIIASTRFVSGSVDGQ